LWLSFCIQHLVGCPLAWKEGHSQEERLFCPLQCDNIGRDSKERVVSYLKGRGWEAMVAEFNQCRVVCVWHHHKRTPADRGDQPADVKAPGRDGASGLLKLEKMLRGCEHPLHSSMPYHSIVSVMGSLDPSQQLPVMGFLHVSHKKRAPPGQTANYKLSKQKKLEDLQSGKAVVHCGFCHHLWTMCEKAQLYGMPYATHRFALQEGVEEEEEDSEEPCQLTEDGS
jgi:hypothetical protein